ETRERLAWRQGLPTASFDCNRGCRSRLRATVRWRRSEELRHPAEPQGRRGAPFRELQIRTGGRGVDPVAAAVRSPQTAWTAARKESPDIRIELRVSRTAACVHRT